MVTLLIIVSGCVLPFGDSDPVVARVRFKKLRVSDVKEVLGSDYLPQQREQFVEDWVNRQLWLIESKRLVRLDREEKPQIRDYRSNLIIRKYQKQYLLNNIMITENDVLQYYEGHRSEFIAETDAAFIELYVCPSNVAAKEVLSSLRSSETPPLSPVIKLVKKNTCVEPIDKALFVEKNKSNLLGPISYGNDYYIVFIIEKYKPGSVFQVEHVRNDIIQRLKITQYSNALQKKQKELKDRLNVKINKNADL